jgi:hypothetical protein
MVHICLLFLIWACRSWKWKKTRSQLCANNNTKEMEKISDLIISFCVSSGACGIIGAYWFTECGWFQEMWWRNHGAYCFPLVFEMILTEDQLLASGWFQSLSGVRLDDATWWCPEAASVTGIRDWSRREEAPTVPVLNLASSVILLVLYWRL